MKECSSGEGPWNRQRIDDSINSKSRCAAFLHGYGGEWRYGRNTPCIRCIAFYRWGWGGGINIYKNFPSAGQCTALPTRRMEPKSSLKSATEIARFSTRRG